MHMSKHSMRRIFYVCRVYRVGSKQVLRCSNGLIPNPWPGCGQETQNFAADADGLPRDKAKANTGESKLSSPSGRVVPTTDSATVLALTSPGLGPDVRPAQTWSSVTRGRRRDAAVGLGAVRGGSWPIRVSHSPRRHGPSRDDWAEQPFAHPSPSSAASSRHGLRRALAGMLLLTPPRRATRRPNMRVRSAA